jgi:cytoskeletal protein CcmA (bactofilin family)
MTRSDLRPPSEPRASTQGAVKELVALLGEGAKFEGKLVFEGRVRIDGHFRGEIEGEGTLVVGDRAEVEANLSVGTLIVLGGTVRGQVLASQMVELHAPAKVFGNITAPQLVIDRGVVFEGQSRVAELDVQQAPGQAAVTVPADQDVPSARESQAPAPTEPDRDK